MRGGMRLHAVVLGLIAAAAAACGDGSLGRSGTAGASGGASGTGGGAGTTGVAGTGGSIGGNGGAGGTGGSRTGLPFCGGAGGGDAIEIGIAGPDGFVVTTAVTAVVTVTAVDSCATASCPDRIQPPAPLGGIVLVDAGATRLVLAAADGRTWTLYLRNTAMPGDLIKVNDSYDMTIEARAETTFITSFDQTIVLAHGADLVAFASNQYMFGLAPLPQLGAFGISVTDGGAYCERRGSSGCLVLPHALQVTVGADTATVLDGTARVGWLSFSTVNFAELRDLGACDSKSRSLTGGFRVP